MSDPNKVSIRPGVSVLSILKFLEYETWFALAEFVDNSIASYLKCEKELKAIEGEDFKLRVRIEIDDVGNKITITDNAAGINAADYPRAFRAAEIPPDTSGLSEFGMGMKSAACWFSDEWSVSTSALGEPTAKVVCFDMQKIFEDKLEKLDVKVTDKSKTSHYTKIELLNVNKMPRVRGLGKVKEHLRGIYRGFTRSGVLDLEVNQEPLHYVEPKILVAPRWDDQHGESIVWKKEIDRVFDKNLSVKGFVAIREKASTSEAGFALFRRGRVIEGSFDKGFRPEAIFGGPNKFAYQRVFGELHLKGFNVNFTKKGIQWDSNLDGFLAILKSELSGKEFPLLQQAENYRVRARDSDYKTTANKALDLTVSDLQKNAPQAITDLVNTTYIEPPEETELVPTDKTIHREFQMLVKSTIWHISIELSYDPSLTDLIEVGNHLLQTAPGDPSQRQVGIRLSLTHPFMVEYVGVDDSKIELVLRIAAVLGISEVIAKESGVRTQGEIRRNLNELITKLSEVK